MSFLSWAAFYDFLLSLVVAFLGGALAYLGKIACQRIMSHISHKRNVFVSKTREELNAYNSPDENDD